MNNDTYRFQVTFVNDSGRAVTVEVEARNQFEAIQLAGAFGKPVRAVVNCDL